MYRSNNLSFSKVAFQSSFLLSVSIIGIIFLFLVKESLPIFYKEGFSFFFGTDWNVGGNIYGALPMIYGTAVVTFLAIAIALPLGLGTAIISSEYLSGTFSVAVKACMEFLAGVPGVVYGLIGITLITTIVKNTFGLLDGNTILTAGLILGVMTLPTIMTLSDDALRSVPKEYREQAYALGLNRAETIIFVVLPGAFKGIVGALLLGLSRAMGETIAVMLVIGSLDRIPNPFYNIFATAQTITSKLGREAAETLGGTGYQWNALMGLGLILFIMVVGITLAGDFILVKPEEETYQERTKSSAHA